VMEGPRNPQHHPAATELLPLCHAWPYARNANTRTCTLPTRGGGVTPPRGRTWTKIRSLLPTFVSPNSRRGLGGSLAPISCTSMVSPSQTLLRSRTYSLTRPPTHSLTPRPPHHSFSTCLCSVHRQVRHPQEHPGPGQGGRGTQVQAGVPTRQVENSTNRIHS
jgi:hypothetical protein